MPSMTTPEDLPAALRNAGVHIDVGEHSATDGTCSMELISLLRHGYFHTEGKLERYSVKTDIVDCVNSFVNRAVMSAQDAIRDDDTRQRMLDLVPLIMACHSSDRDADINLRLITWFKDYITSRSEGTPAEPIVRESLRLMDQGFAWDEKNPGIGCLDPTVRVPWKTFADYVAETDTELLLFLTDMLDAWQKIAADEGILGAAWETEFVCFATELA